MFVELKGSHSLCTVWIIHQTWASWEGPEWRLRWKDKPPCGAKVESLLLSPSVSVSLSLTLSLCLCLSLSICIHVASVRGDGKKTEEERTSNGPGASGSIHRSHDV